MLVRLQDLDQLDLAGLVLHVDRPVGSVQPHRSLTLAPALQRFVVETNESPWDDQQPCLPIELWRDSALLVAKSPVDKRDESKAAAVGLSDDFLSREPEGLRRNEVVFLKGRRRSEAPRWITRRPAPKGPAVKSDESEVHENL